MTLEIKHSFVSAIADDPQSVIDGEVLPSHWNATHTMTGTKAEFNTACSDGDFLYVGDVVSYTDESVDDRVSALIQNGTGITWSYNDAGGTLTPTVTITQYTDEMAQDAVGAMVNTSLTYVDGTPSLGLTSRTINGTAFDGTANITVTAAAGTLTGASLNATVTGSSLTSLGTIATGVWQGTAVADTYIASAATWNAKQAGDATLTALAAYSTNGLLTQTAADTFTGRTVTGTANEISVADGNGVAGNPTLSLPATIDLGGKTSLEIPNSAAPTVDADGEIALDTTVADWANGVLKYFSTAEMGVVAMPIAQFTAPTNGYVPTYNSTTDRFELAAASAVVADGDKGDISISGGVWTIDPSVVTLAKQADVATASVFYRKTAGSGAPEVQTLATLKTDLGLTGTNSGDQSLFSTIAVSGQSDVVADAASDTLTLVAGSNITITTNAGTDTITIAATGGGGITIGLAQMLSIGATY